MAIAQTQIEQASNPSMTAFTTQWACRNSAINDTSADGSGNAATSAGFIGNILSTQASQSSGSKWLPVPQPRAGTRR